jgi:hypothetical protein
MSGALSCFGARGIFGVRRLLDRTGSDAQADVDWIGEWTAMRRPILTPLPLL